MILKCFVDIHNAQRLKMMEGKYIIESNDRIHRLPWETNEMSYLITYEKQPLLNHEHCEYLQSDQGMHSDAKRSFSIDLTLTVIVLTGFTSAERHSSTPDAAKVLVGEEESVSTQLCPSPCIVTSTMTWLGKVLFLTPSALILTLHPESST